MNLRQREPRYENRALLDLCYQIPCTADFPHECGPSEPAHSNQSRHGKGKSIKAHDCFVAALCRNAHREIDQGRIFSRSQRNWEWSVAHDRTMLQMWQRGLIQTGASEYISTGGNYVMHTTFFEASPKKRRRPASKTQRSSKTIPRTNTWQR